MKPFESGPAPEAPGPRAAPGRPGVEAPPETGPRAGVAEPVVGPALLLVLEHLVGLLDLLEALLGGLVARIDVGMELSGQTAVGLLNFGLRGPF